jgi:NADP-dependent 3-hydroxy acid dehydrogenase YdfG
MAEAKPFTGKVILITGAASGIGQATATYLAARGATLSLCDISSSRLEVVEKAVRDSFAGTQVLTHTVDVCDPKQVEEWVLASKEKFGKIDGCVNSAGNSPDTYGTSVGHLSISNSARRR